MDTIVFSVSNKIFFDFVQFNKLAGRENYASILEHILGVIRSVLQVHDNFQMHVSLFSFSVVHLKKHKQFIEMFSAHNQMFNDSFVEMHVYYTPSVLDLIIKIVSRIFKNTSHRPQFFFYNKSESAAKLENVFATPAVDDDDAENETMDEFLV
jgi:hypothetical protein